MKIFITFPKFCHFSRTKFSHLSYSEREKKMTLVHFRKKIAKKKETLIQKETLRRCNWNMQIVAISLLKLALSNNLNILEHIQ